jgi:tetratricopeptide (TPR) repeat protein
MKRNLMLSIFMVFVPGMLFAVTSKPILLLFPVNPGEGAGKDMGIEATRAFKSYLTETGKADITDLDPDSPLLVRAIQENRIQKEDVGSATTPEARLKIAQLLGINLVISGDVWVKDDKVNLSAWLGDTKTKKIGMLATAVKISADGDYARATSNALQSAASTLMIQLADEALKEVKPAKPLDTTNVVDSGSATVEPDLVMPADDSGTYLTSAEQYLKAGDDANAILAYRRAINVDPKNIDIRVKLSKLYTNRRMFPQAIDELERAQQIDPKNEAVRNELARVYEAKGSPDKAAGVYVKQADTNPKDISARITAGDSYYAQKNLGEAEKQYQLAAQTDPASPVPHEKLMLLFAGQSRFSDAGKELEQLQKLDSKPDQQALSKRYSSAITSVGTGLNSLIFEYDAATSNFADHNITREACYDIIKGLNPRLDDISAFVQTITPPDASTASNKRLVLGCNLLSQSASRALSYLETNKSSVKEDAAILFAQAKKNIAAGLGK